MPRRTRAWRIVFRAALAASVLLAAAAVTGIWRDFGVYGPGGTCVAFHRGTATVGRYGDWADLFPGYFWQERHPHWRSWQARYDQWDEWEATVPSWVPLAASLAVAGLAVRLGRPPTAGLCRRCRYDLNGLPLARGAAVICPECGAEAA